MESILDRIKHGEILIGDGAWGTQLFDRGLNPGESPEMWNLTHRKSVLEVAQAYVDAGSDIIETNSFGGSPINLSQHELGNQAFEINKVAAEISREAAGDAVLVAGSIGPCGKMIMMGDISENEIYESFALQAKALEEGGANIILVETMISLDEFTIAVKASRENTNLMVMASATYNKTPDGKFMTMMGNSLDEMCDAAIREGASIVGTNCGHGIEFMIEVVNEIHGHYPEIPILVQPNAGLPGMKDGEVYYPETPEFMASRSVELKSGGARIIGGCCGTTPEHIKAYAKTLKN